MLHRLPATADPIRLCDLGAKYVGTIALKQFERLRALLSDTDGVVRYELHFFRDDSGRACIGGRIQASMRVPCQRCLEPMDIVVHQHPTLAIVQGIDEMDRLPDSLDPLLLESEGRIAPLAVIEDELLLALPQVPRHEAEVCGVSLRDMSTVEDTERAFDDRFAGLAALRKTLKDDNP